MGEIAKFLIEEGHDKALVKHLKHELLRQTLPAESLIWICRQRHDASKPLFGLPVGIAMLSLIEQDHMDGGPNRMLRLKNLFMEDKNIIQEMIKGQDVAEVRQFAKMLYNTSAFSEQDRGALMARVISVFPDLHAIVLDALVDTSDKPEPIFVSWDSLEARKKELEELVNVKIPENLHNKKISRAEGDLRENGGYQDAKEVEKVLNRRRSELEHALALARGHGLCRDGYLQGRHGDEGDSPAPDRRGCRGVHHSGRVGYESGKAHCLLSFPGRQGADGQERGRPGEDRADGRRQEESVHHYED